MFGLMELPRQRLQDTLGAGDVEHLWAVLTWVAEDVLVAVSALRLESDLRDIYPLSPLPAIPASLGGHRGQMAL